MPQTDVALPTMLRTSTQEAKHRRFWSSDNPWLWLIPALSLLLFYSIFPLIYNLLLSFHEWHIRRKVFLPVGLDNWANLLSNADGRFYNALSVTFQYTVIALITELALGLLIALLLDARPWGAGIMQTLIILPMVTAPAVAGMLFRLLENSDFGVLSWAMYGLGLIEKTEPFLGGTGQNALLGVILVDVWQWTPFFVLILVAGLKALPPEVLEAAEVDGANWLQRLLRIKIPLLGAVLTVAILFRLVDLYRVIDYVFIMTSGGPGIRTTTLSYYGYINMFGLIKWGYGAAIAITLLLIAWLTAFFYQKIFRVKW